MEEIKCSRCSQLKPTSEFSKRPNRRRGYHSFCKQCFREYKREWQAEEYKDPIRKARRLKHSQENKKRNHIRKMHWILDYLKIHPCIDCGETDPIVLEFDHQRDKTEGVCSMVHQNCGLERVKEEIQKCVVRCANCHRRKTAKDFNHMKFRFLEEEKQDVN